MLVILFVVGTRLRIGSSRPNKKKNKALNYNGNSVVKTNKKSMEEKK